MLGHVSNNYWEVAPYVLELFSMNPRFSVKLTRPMAPARESIWNNKIVIEIIMRQQEQVDTRRAYHTRPQLRNR